MGLIREPKEIDFSGKSKPWSEEELIDFRKIMTELKRKKRKKSISNKPKNIAQTN